jgi:hypothetical protein
LFGTKFYKIFKKIIGERRAIITMQKLKVCVLDNMFEKKLTKAEIDFIVLISRFQNDHGIVEGVYYKEICSELEISNQTFYDIKNALIEKNIIKAIKGSYTDWNIQINNNDCSDPESFKDNYINTNHDMFYTKEFFSLKAGEKLLAMHFLKISQAGRGSYNIGVSKFYDKYMKLLGITKRVLQNYMSSLKEFFSIGIKDKQYWITPLTKVFRKYGTGRTEVSNYNKHIGETICRREKVKYNTHALEDTVALLKQYRNILLNKAETMLHKAVKLSIEKANENVKNPYKWKRVLQPKLVHKILRDVLIPQYI